METRFDLRYLLSRLHSPDVASPRSRPHRGLPVVLVCKRRVDLDPPIRHTSPSETPQSYPLAWGLRRLFLLYAYLLSLAGGGFHRGFPLLSQSLAAAIRHTTSKDYSLPPSSPLWVLGSLLLAARSNVTLP